MNLKLKPIHEQVIIITGASSGIGLATAKMAAERGARIVLSSRNEEELRRITEEINTKFGRGRAIAAYVVADVADPAQVERIAQTAIREFGGFDTWVNNAGITIYGKLNETPLLEKRRLFDVNFWGVIHGCRSALPHLRERGGAIINIGSATSDRAIPVQGIYSASKHAVKAYTDVLRMEVEADGAPVSISLIKPGSIDTPYVEHARNHLGFEPKLPPPLYAPEIVAEAILACAQRPQRDIFVGSSAKAFALAETFAPRLTDKAMERWFFTQQQSENPSRPGRKDALFTPPPQEGRVSGNSEGPVARTSIYTSTTLQPMKVAFMAAAAIGSIGALLSLLGTRSARQSLENLARGQVRRDQVGREQLDDLQPRFF